MEENLNDEILKLDTFKEYLHAFKQTSEYKKLTESKAYRDSKDEDKISLERTHFIAYAQKIEKDKLLYFSLSLNQEVLIIKAPSDIKEQKRFLGYEWSNRKGDEGLKELSNPYESPLFERDNPHNDFKLNTLIRKSFDNTLDSIPQELQPYATKARLIDMIDFSKVEFNKAISLNPHSNDSHSVQSNPFANSKYELVKLGEVILENPKSKIQVREAKENTTGAYPFYTSGVNIYRYDEALTSGENIYLSTGGNALVQFYRGESAYSTDTYAIKADSKKMLTKFLFYVLQMQQGYINQFLFKGSGLKHLQKPEFKNLKIPLPPLEIQKQIVSECESLESRCNTIEQSIRAYQELIKAILWHCGITTESTKDFDSILMSLAELESKLDFELLGKTKQDSNAFLQNLTNTLNTLPTPPSNGWEKVKLGSIGKISMCKRIFKHETNEVDGIPFYKIGTFGGKATTYIDKEKFENYKQKYPYPKKGEVLISAAGTLGKSVIYNGESAYFQDSNIVWISNNETKALNNYLFVVYQKIDWQQYKTSGSVIERLYNENIANIQIPLPPLEIQTKITQSIETIQSQISFLDSALPLLQSQKQEVLKKYLF